MGSFRKALGSGAPLSRCFSSARWGFRFESKCAQALKAHLLRVGLGLLVSQSAKVPTAVILDLVDWVALLCSAFEAMAKKEVEDVLHTLWRFS